MSDNNSTNNGGKIENPESLETASEKTAKGKMNPAVFIPVLVFVLALLIRCLLVIPLTGQADILLKWAAQSNLITHPRLDFSHLYLLYRDSLCTPFYYLISFILWNIFKFLQAFLAAYELSDSAWVIINNILLKLPVIMADLGIGIIIYNLLRKKFCYKLSTLGMALYILCPPVIFSEVWRVQTFPVSLFFVLLSLVLLERNDKWKALSGISFTAGVMSGFNPIVILPWLCILLHRIFLKKEIKGHISTLAVFILSFVLFTGVFSRFFLAPPDTSVFAPGEMPPQLSQPLDKQERVFFPFGMVYRNTFNTPYVINPAFNLWTIRGVMADDGVLSLPIWGIDRRKLGYILAFASLLLLLIIYSKIKSPGLHHSLLLFAGTYMILFLLHTRGQDYFMLGVLPFLTSLFLMDYRARLLWYGVAPLFLVNMFFNNQFNINPGVPTAVPFLANSASLLNLMLFIGFFLYFYRASGEKDPTSAGENLKEKILGRLPFLQKAQNWLLIPENQQLVILLAVAFTVRIWRIGVPQNINFDEKYYVPMARDYINGNFEPVVQASHPPLSTFIIGVGIKLFGNNPFGWRIMSLLFSLLMITVTYYFARALFKNHLPALFAGYLLTFDFLHFVQSRLGMLDMFSAFFNLCSYYLLYLYMERGRSRHLWLMGLTLGLGLACKWTALFTIAGITTIFAAGKIAGIFMKDRLKYSQVLKKTGIVIIIAVVFVIPLLLQLLSFQILYHGSLVAAFQKIELLLGYHENLITKDKISSPWWSWLFIINPIQYLRGAHGQPQVIEEGPFIVTKLTELDATIIFAVTGMGNPIVWWLSIPAFFAAMILGYRRRDAAVVFACMLFIFQFLPWAFAKRITYIFYMIDIVPYISIILAYCIHAVYQRGKRGRIIAYSYLGLVFLSFAAFYPLLTALQLPPAIYKLYKIFDFWQFK